MSHPIANLRHMVLPVIVLGTGFAAGLMRQTRSSMLELARRRLRAHGARRRGCREWRVVGRHALRNSLITVATLIALDFGAAPLRRGDHRVRSSASRASDGSASTRSTRATTRRSRGSCSITALVYVVVNLVVDIVYSLLDPRIRITGAPE